VDGLELLYPASSDLQISEHLRKNHLRPIAIKRKGGTLVTVMRADGRDALAEDLVDDVPGGYALPAGTPPEPLDEQLVDGQDLEYRDVLAAGFTRAQWMGTYTIGRWDLGVIERSRIIQLSRVKLGLPPSENGVSQEYQGLLNKGRNRILFDAVPILLSFIFPAILPAFRGLFFVEETAATSVAVTEIGATGAATAADVGTAQIVLPNMTRLADFALPGSPRAVALAAEYRAAQTGGRLSGRARALSGRRGIS
jgi:hypothetical protein